MTPRRLLVVATTHVDASRLREQVREQAGGGAAEVRVVAPAADVSPLKWLMTDVDEARGEAEAVAAEAAEAVEGDATVVEADVGDSDPVQAISEALATFPADELIIVTREGEEAGWLEKDTAEAALERFGLPVTHLPVDGG